MPEPVAESQIDEARPGDLGAAHRRVAAQRLDQAGGKLARVLAGRLGQHHRRIGGDVAMRGVARRLDRDAAEIETGGQHAGTRQPLDFGLNFVQKVFEKVHVVVA